MSTIYFTRHSGGLTFYRDGKQYTVSSDYANFDKILNNLKSKAFDNIETLINLGNTITRQGKSTKNKDRSVFVRDGEVYYVDINGKEVQLHGTLVDRILNDIGKSSGAKFADALLRFLDNIMKNTQKDVRDELYEFLMSGKTPITYDGCFLAYKKVDKNFKDIYTGTMDNAPGQVVRIDASEVDKDRHNTCSTGLHFASLGYLQYYGSRDSDNFRIVIVKVNPKNVYAIPTDYNFQKGRASEYYVVGEHTGTSDAFADSFIDEDTKFTSAPEVKFVGSLRPSLQATAQSYGMINSNGKVYVVFNSKGKYIPVRKENNKILDIMNDEWIVDPVGIFEMSLTTKNVNSAMKEAIARKEKGKKSRK